jgi:hypothetical protein
MGRSIAMSAPIVVEKLIVMNAPYPSLFKKRFKEFGSNAKE